MKSLGIHAAVRPKTTSGIVGGKKFLCVIVCQLNPHSVIQQVNNEKQAQNESENTARFAPFMSTGQNLKIYVFKKKEKRRKEKQP